MAARGGGLSASFFSAFWRPHRGRTRGGGFWSRLTEIETANVCVVFFWSTSTPQQRGWGRAQAGRRQAGPRDPFPKDPPGGVCVWRGGWRGVWRSGGWRVESERCVKGERCSPVPPSKARACAQSAPIQACLSGCGHPLAWACWPARGWAVPPSKPLTQAPNLPLPVQQQATRQAHPPPSP